MLINHIPWEIRNPQFSLMLIVFCLTATNSQALPALAFCLDYLLKLMMEGVLAVALISMQLLATVRVVIDQLL